ncbi:hypothetical protein Y027_5269 [Burkholderia pseudomallei TSV5]|nr:hypothetical protein DO70_4688 [Burkholderia pseudomallei]KGR94982.1 hypothetical protein X948_5142 [Burkholderia pseudomallei MSHR5608]KGS22151.1 hypothetical protein X962_5351 [Burkholderia pseudomallei MSHR7343]KGS22294.1 hypothetical protein X941_5463 [Burkholderia pseudomallei MSHR5569]KGS36512.1 hypothetical protein X945_5557 [Burkholderia pseudomallei ABCPW 107]KGS38100.1 hypothetical protein X992_5557 [Burkholderia pseudomallei MSHR5492]KGS74258.1 hypothetical protein X942_5511 [Bu
MRDGNTDLAALIYMSAIRVPAIMRNSLLSLMTNCLS